MIDDRAETEDTADSTEMDEELVRLLDERVALARDPTRKRYTLKEIAARHGVLLADYRK
jgi:hypothetical protein